MIQVSAYPPNIEDIKKTFNIEGRKGIVFTHGQVIYNPDMYYLDDPLLFHEATHSIQQDTLGADAWWKKYLENPKFRLKQELEAYHEQYKKYCKTQKDRNKQVQYLHRLAIDCSGEVYGNMINYSDARKWIRNGKTN